MDRMVREQLVQVGDVSIFVCELGERVSGQPSVVVMHGGPDVGHGYLVPGFEPLAGDHHVVLFDYRGCGKSSRGLPDDALQPEFVVEDTFGLIEELDLGVVDLIGFSTGGRAAVAYVDRHPTSIRRLVMASTSAYPSAASEPFVQDWQEYQRRRRIEDAAGGELRNSTIFVWDLDLAPRYLQLIKDCDEGDWSYERFLDGRMHPWVRGDPVEILRGSGKATLILHGEKDMGFPVQLADRLHRELAGSQLVVIPDAAHMCHFEKPDLWSDHIRRFLA